MTLFVYGTLLFPKIREAVAGRVFDFLPARLPGYQIFTIKDATFPGIVAVEDPECWVAGEILFDLSDEEVARFDSYEDSFYRRTMIRAIPADGQEIAAAVYEIPVEWADSLLSDLPWTQAWFAERHYCDFCADLGL